MIQLCTNQKFFLCHTPSSPGISLFPYDNLSFSMLHLIYLNNFFLTAHTLLVVSKLTTRLISATQLKLLYISPFALTRKLYLCHYIVTDPLPAAGHLTLQHLKTHLASPAGPTRTKENRLKELPHLQNSFCTRG